MKAISIDRIEIVVAPRIGTVRGAAAAQAASVKWDDVKIENRDQRLDAGDRVNENREETGTVPTGLVGRHKVSRGAVHAPILLRTGLGVAVPAEDRELNGCEMKTDQVRGNTLRVGNGPAEVEAGNLRQVARIGVHLDEVSAVEARGQQHLLTS